MNALAELIARAGRQFAARIAVIGAERSLSFAEVDEESNRLAAGLRATPPPTRRSAARNRHEGASVS